MLNRKDATDTACKHLVGLIPVEGTPILEEHFFADGIWQITLSYKPSGSASANGTGVTKEYKSFSVDGRTGEVLSMRIRS
jgi:hypothetical protein